MYTSRSAVEVYQACNFYRYNQNFREGMGLVATSNSVPLVTGGEVHRGVEHLMNRIRIKEEPDVNTAVGLAVENYIKECEGKGFRGKDLQGDRQQWFTFNEQKALVEGLIRAWGHCEMPKIREQYEVLAVEREIEPIGIAPNVKFMAKIDAEMRDKGNGQYVNYSLKTAASWGDRMEESYKSDLQGITEIWAVDQDNIRNNERLDHAIGHVREANSLKPKKAFMDIIKYLEGQRVDKQVSAIRFCYLIKGAWKKEDRSEDAIKKTFSPLIRGYKHISPSGINYAHSYWYPNPNNKSGQGNLGSGWNAFNVWEEMGVKEWFEMLVSGEMQPECGDIIKAQVITPVEYFRNEGEIREGIEEVRYQEEFIESAVGILNNDYSEEYKYKTMRQAFRKNRKHCFFHFGGRCEYYELCFKPEISEDPIGSGLYQIRTPHHETEGK